ncbi:ribosomal protein S10 [Cenarchaeum symbiosum A]|uniref:Small ribosomal subunit protein uS10 n=1 Tax=Cenarchaeum symbiosum (strain A) TaxID=414004 RepID=RS10_CENSY|nr:RecName: Full=Small ribosomal subunit protein uS10; AltName: Full=30S ribosomal protein S10 [Cenarchaeum symbiosum A]ABK77042.1 ribosomal protein S10 [Cenarchaeum symbiosum A]
MTQSARVKLTSINLLKLDGVCGIIMDIGKRTGVRIKGPTPLPVKKLHIATRKSPCGSGTETYEKWEMRMHRRIIDISADDKTIRRLIDLKIPDDVHLELFLT